MTISFFQDFVEFDTMQNMLAYCKAIMNKLSGFQDGDIMMIMMITTYPNIAWHQLTTNIPHIQNIDKNPHSSIIFTGNLLNC